MTTSKRPVTHPATQDIQRHLDQARDAYHAAYADDSDQTAPPASTSAPSAASRGSGVSQRPDAADGRTAAQEDVVEQAARAILAGLKAKDRRDCEEMVRSGITPNRVRPDWRVESWTAARALADAGLLRDDAADEWRAELVAIVRTVRERNDRLTRERDDLLEAVKPANDYALRKGYTTFSGGVDRVRHEVGLLARDIALAEERAERAERERDDLLEMKARVEALRLTCLCGFCHECGAEWPCRTHVAIRGES